MLPFPNSVSLCVPARDKQIQFQMITPSNSTHMFIVQNHNNINNVTIATGINHNELLTLHHNNYTRNSGYIRCSDKSQFIHGLLQEVLRLVKLTLWCIHIWIHIPLNSNPFYFCFSFIWYFFLFWSVSSKLFDQESSYTCTWQSQHMLLFLHTWFNFKYTVLIILLCFLGFLKFSLSQYFKITLSLFLI